MGQGSKVVVLGPESISTQRKEREKKLQSRLTFFGVVAFLVVVFFLVTGAA